MFFVRVVLHRLLFNNEPTLIVGAKYPANIPHTSNVAVLLTSKCRDNRQRGENVISVYFSGDSYSCS